MSFVFDQLVLSSSDYIFPITVDLDSIIHINGLSKIRCKGTTPTLTVTNPLTPDTSTIEGTDLSGTITINTDTGNLLGRICIVTFNQPLTYDCVPILTSCNLETANIGIYATNCTNTGFDVYISQTPADNDVYKLNYFIVELNQ